MGCFLPVPRVAPTSRLCVHQDRALAATALKDSNISSQCDLSSFSLNRQGRERPLPCSASAMGVSECAPVRVGLFVVGVLFLVFEV